MLFSMKQFVAFVAGQDRPGIFPEHLGVALESPGWPGHFEVQGRESAVVQSLQGHLWVNKGKSDSVQGEDRLLKQ